MDDQLKERVLKVINKISATKIENIDVDDDAVSQLAFDSIQFIELFAALELEFGIELPLDMMNIRKGREFLGRLETELTNKATA